VHAGRDQINPQQLKVDPKSAAKVAGLLLAAGVPLNAKLNRKDRPAKVPISKVSEIVNAVSVAADDPGIWDSDMVLALIRSYEGALQGEMTVYVRPLEDTGRTRARLSGPEIKLLRSISNKAPALALLHSGEANAPQGWYPTIVMPEGSPAFVFSGE
jgi:hypothetical protein